VASSDERVPDTASPARNFTLTTDDRLRAFTQGPLAYMRRRRAIDDLRETLVRALAEPGPKDHPARTARIASDLAKLNQLIDRHNRYYPIEANLPISPRTGQLLDRGVPWRPMPPVTLDELVARSAHAAAAKR
jgi:hypothetical protein